ncbi:MAG: M28 family peptidase [Anaerolineae bacterium]
MWAAFLALGMASTAIAAAPEPSIFGPPEHAPARPEGPTPLTKLISDESLLNYVRTLSSIEAYSGWRSAGTEGERQAFDYIEGVLSSLDNLRAMGMRVEREEFRIPMATEIWETELEIALSPGRRYTIPASASWGPRDNPNLASQMDTDGSLQDVERNPLSVRGPALFLDSWEKWETTTPEELKGYILFLDYSIIDPYAGPVSKAEGESRWEKISRALARFNAWAKGEKYGPAGLVLVTHYSSRPGEGHGLAIGTSSPLLYADCLPCPFLFARIEDFRPAGIYEMADLEKIVEAKLTLDLDVREVASSGNLVALIPGREGSQAVILGAHIDSVNTSGALDDATGAAILLEIARILDEADFQPGLTTCLVWFGSEEIGLLGSGAFVARHEELMEQTLAMIQVDCLSSPLEGVHRTFTIASHPYGQRSELRLMNHLARLGEKLGMEIKTESSSHPYSDNYGFAAFDLPNAVIIYLDTEAAEKAGGVHYAATFHCPYDRLELVEKEKEAFHQMATWTLTSLLSFADPTDGERPSFRYIKPSEGRAVFIASHTESPSMNLLGLVHLSQNLIHNGLDVDWAPYGRALSSADLEGAELVFALPVMDYPLSEGGPYDEVWAGPEIEALDDYVRRGGLLVLVASDADNEDWADMNQLAQRFRTRFEGRVLNAGQARIVATHPLVSGLEILDIENLNARPISFEKGRTLAEAEGEPVVVLVPYGEGEVLLLGDFGILKADYNLPFWRALARYAIGRR